jgi:hypothetical protein
MFTYLEGPERKFFGAGFQGYFPGGNAEAIKDHVTSVLPEFECDYEESNGEFVFGSAMGPRFIYFYNFPSTRDPNSRIDLSLRVEADPSIVFTTKRLLGFEYHKTPFHLLELCACSRNQVILFTAIANFLIKRPELNIKSRKFASSQSGEEEQAALRTRLLKFCERDYSSFREPRAFTNLA